MKNKLLYTSLIAFSVSSGNVFATLSGKISNNVDKIMFTEIENINNKISNNIKKSREYIGDLEFNFFYEYFNLTSIFEFDEKVKSIQERFGLIQDGILGNITLEKIYLSYYMYNNKKITNPTINKRIDIYFDMLGYSKINGALYNGFNVFNKNTFYGSNTTSNVENTYINEEIYMLVTHNLNDNKNIIKVSNILGRNLILVYLNGKLVLATFVSTGKEGYSTPKLKEYGKRNPDKYHTSDTYPEVNKLSKTGKGGAVMPYAVHIDGPIWLHASDGRIDGKPQSHGCVRVPVYYMEKIYEIVQNIGKENILIDTTFIDIK